MRNHRLKLHFKAEGEIIIGTAGYGKESSFRFFPIISPPLGAIL